jgi:hypothetical protein
MHRIFQEDPKVFARTFRALGFPFDDPVTATVMPTDLTEIRPLERRVDTLLKLEDNKGGGILLAVEAQGKKEAKKEGSWTYYLAHLYEKYKLPPVLLVVCQDRRTAIWAGAPVRIGPPQWASLIMRPLVLGPHNVPVITDPAEAARDIPLATLSAVTHAKEPGAAAILKVLASAMKTLDEDTAALFSDLPELGLGETPAARTWRKLMAIDLSLLHGPTSQRLRAEARAEGLAEGRAEGLAEGRAEGRAEATARSILLVLDQRGIDVPDDARERIAGCREPETLDGWFTRAVTAGSVDEVFGES